MRGLVACLVVLGCGDNLSGALDAQLVVSPTAWNFGVLGAGVASAPHVFTITNEGAAPTTSVSATLLGSDALDFGLTSTCTDAIAAGASCSVSVTCAPTTLGPKSATLRASAMAGGDVEATLMCASFDGHLTVTSPGNDFGSVGVGGPPSVPIPFTVAWSQHAAGPPTSSLTIQLSGTNANEFDIAADACSDTSLAPNQTCIVDVVFAPTTTGLKSAQLIASSASTGSATAPLYGTATTDGGGFITVSPTLYDFGTVAIGQQLQSPFSITNAGGTSTGPLVTAIDGADASQFTRVNDQCAGTSVAPGAACTIDVQFAPTSSGTKTATLRVTSPTMNMVAAALRGQAP